MNKNEVVKVLGREQYKDLLSNKLLLLPTEERVLITGANGSIGTALTHRLKQYGIAACLTTDIEGKHKYLDVTDFQNAFSVINKFQPTVIINVAGEKHAPLGEREIWKTLSVNTIGMKNLIDAAPRGCRLILASTCKANNPEIVYGASKAIAEKMVLAAGGSIARFFNVVESSGNVFEIWKDTKHNEPIKVVSSCERHFISLEESIGLILYTMTSKPGRYIVNTPIIRNMQEIADTLYPKREQILIEPRVGDRLIELFKSSAEEIETTCLNSAIVKLKSAHDIGEQNV